MRPAILSYSMATWDSGGRPTNVAGRAPDSLTRPTTPGSNEIALWERSRALPISRCRANAAGGQHSSPALPSMFASTYNWRRTATHSEKRGMGEGFVDAGFFVAPSGRSTAGGRCTVYAGAREVDLREAGTDLSLEIPVGK
jgi:hypothetical protein